MEEETLVPAERIETSILFIRDQKVLLDADLSELNGVETKVLVQAVKRNKARFPADFMFQLSPEEYQGIKSHFGGSGRWGGRRYPPYAFTEQGVAMLSSVMNSSRAIMVNIEVIRTFVRLRHMMATHGDLARKLDALEKKYDMQFSAVFDALRQLMLPPDPKKKQIGFHWDKKPAAKKKKAPARKNVPARKNSD